MEVTMFNKLRQFISNETFKLKRALFPTSLCDQKYCLCINCMETTCERCHCGFCDGVKKKYCSCYRKPEDKSC